MAKIMKNAQTTKTFNGAEVPQGNTLYLSLKLGEQYLIQIFDYIEFYKIFGHPDVSEDEFSGSCVAKIKRLLNYSDQDSKQSYGWNALVYNHKLSMFQFATNLKPSFSRSLLEVLKNNGISIQEVYKYSFLVSVKPSENPKDKRHTYDITLRCVSDSDKRKSSDAIDEYKELGDEDFDLMKNLNFAAVGGKISGTDQYYEEGDFLVGENDKPISNSSNSTTTWANTTVALVAPTYNASKSPVENITNVYKYLNKAQSVSKEGFREELGIVSASLIGDNLFKLTDLLESEAEKDTPISKLIARSLGEKHNNETEELFNQMLAKYGVENIDDIVDDDEEEPF